MVHDHYVFYRVLKKVDVKKIQMVQEVKKIFLILNDYYLKMMMIMLVVVEEEVLDIWMNANVELYEFVVGDGAVVRSLFHDHLVIHICFYNKKRYSSVYDI
jgi:hypothetical protein